MKILFCAPRFHTNQREIVRVLLERGHAVNYLVMFCSEIEDHSLLQPELIPSKYSENPAVLMKDELIYIAQYPVDIVATYRLIKGKAPDLVIVRDRTKTMRIISVICKLLRIPVILYDQRPLYQRKERTANSIKRWIYNIGVPAVRYTPVVYSTCEHENSQAEMVMTTRRAHYAPFVVAVPERAKEVYQRNGILRIIDVGKYRPQKNHALLIEAVARCKHRDKVRVTMIGQAKSETEETYLANLRELIERKGIQNSFELLCNIAPGEMAHYYDENDVLVLCSLKELASISVLEAMACGLSILASVENGTSSLIRLNDTGMVFDPKNAGELAEEIDHYFEETGCAERMGRAARAYILENHSPLQFIDAMNAMLHGIKNDLQV